jgi:hypothetical protein
MCSMRVRLAADCILLCRSSCTRAASNTIAQRSCGSSSRRSIGYFSIM